MLCKYMISQEAHYGDRAILHIQKSQSYFSRHCCPAPHGMGHIVHEKPILDLAIQIPRCYFRVTFNRRYVFSMAGHHSSVTKSPTANVLHS